MTTIKQLLVTKGREVLSIGPDGSVYDAIKLMADKNVGLLVVMKDDRLAGVITERHYARNVFLKGRPPSCRRHANQNNGDGGRTFWVDLVILELLEQANNFRMRCMKLIYRASSWLSFLHP
ncbi:MAG: CBS domain-containing protein [Paracoccaceae bacterium]